jgi:hypothetical protein
MREKIADPIIVQMIGMVLPSTETGIIAGRPNRAANQLPIKAPINPITIDTRQPPSEYPANVWPTPPQIAAINKRIKNPINVMNDCCLLKV